MGALLLLYLLGRNNRRYSDDDEVIWAVLLLPLVITITAPYIWWVRARDAGLARWSAAIDTIATAALPVVLGHRFGWWLVPLVLLVEGLWGLLAISVRAKGEARRERREREREEADWLATTGNTNNQE